MGSTNISESPTLTTGVMEEAPRMLVVDDNEMVRSTLQEFFEAEGFDVVVAADGETALDNMREESFDVVLLDVMLPRRNGFDVLRESQEMGLLSPVLMLTGRGEQENILRGFGLGAADYVVKPFSPEDLLSRVRVLVGRGTGAHGGEIEAFEVGDLHIDFRHSLLRRGEAESELSEVESDILRYLVQHRGQVVTLRRLVREALTIDMDTVGFSIDEETTMRTMEQHVASLRSKLELNPSKPKLLETVYGLGYRFNG
ncbi:MAG TPA: response regulator transcription factor [Rhodothermales bacterium]|nr:response regulator transcription factor [Rhodothermales bacterium]